MSEWTVTVNIRVDQAGIGTYLHGSGGARRWDRSYRGQSVGPQGGSMKRPAKVYPAHMCLSCQRMTTNRNYCDLHRNVFMANPRIPRSTSIQAERETGIGRRRESSGEI